jgi:hypothetical protein
LENLGCDRVSGGSQQRHIRRTSAGDDKTDVTPSIQGRPGTIFANVFDKFKATTVSL